MLNAKLLKISLLSAVGCLCASACSLPAPAARDGGIGIVKCDLTAGDAGAVDAGSSVIATGDVENVVSATVCPPPGSTNANPNAIDKYTQLKTTYIKIS